MATAAACAAVFLASVVLSGSARAGATVDLLFVAVNGAPIAPTDTVTVHKPAGDLLTMALVLSNDEPIPGFGFSLEYDRTDTELEVRSGRLWAGIPIGTGNAYFGPVVPLCNNGCREGFLTTFHSLWNFGGFGEGVVGLLPGTYQVGTVTWRTRAASTDGADVFSGVFNRGVDGFLDAAFEIIDGEIVFRTASVILNPEPATAFLFGAGLCALAAARRRRRG